MVDTYEQIESEAKDIARELANLAKNGPTVENGHAIQIKLNELSKLGPRLDNLPE